MTLQTLIDAIVANGKVSESRAHYVVRVYRRLNLLTANAHDGYQLKHGALLDREVIERAASGPMPQWSGRGARDRALADVRTVGSN